MFSPKTKQSTPAQRVSVAEQVSKKRAVQRSKAGSVPSKAAAQNAKAVVQRRLGFELEMLALVDINGRPIPEKTMLGSYGAHNLALTVDHGEAVAAPTPTPAYRANFSIPGTPGPFGRYDTPLGTGTRTAHPGVGLDPRLATPVNWLSYANWAAATVAIDRTRVQNPANAHLVQIDTLLGGNYQGLFENWERGQALALLAQIRAGINNWRAANPNANTRFGHPFSNARRTARYNTALGHLNNLDAEITVHLAMWAGNPNPPVGMQRQYQPGGVGPWTAVHPSFQPQEGMGTDRYASILEIVTPGGPGYEPETPAGTGNILAAMTEAAALATAIGGATNNFARRVPLNTVGGTNITNAATHIGNLNQPAQTTDASIQSTFAVDLAQLPSYVRSTLGFGGQNLYNIKHHSDDFVPHPVLHTVAIDRAKVELNSAAGDAAAIINGIGRPVGIGAPTLANLRGLLVIICQYLRMGKYYFYNGAPGLDKNIVDLLSRTDLSVIYNRNVPGLAATPNTEKNWVFTNQAALINAIKVRAVRTGGTRLFTDAAEAWAAPVGYPAHYLVTVDQFLTNIFTQASDGVTPHFGGWVAPFPTEDVDPTGARGGDSRPVGAAHREGPVFELRNMVPVALGQARFPYAQWLPLATYISALLGALNARNEAAAGVNDVRYGGGALHNQPAW
jgi:hypothetical protein